MSRRDSSSRSGDPREDYSDLQYSSLALVVLIARVELVPASIRKKQRDLCLLGVSSLLSKRSPLALIFLFVTVELPSSLLFYSPSRATYCCTH